MFAVFAILPAVVVVAPGASPAVRAIAAVITAAFLWAAYRSWRMAVIVGPEGVVVRNFARTTRIPWDDVDAFVSSNWLSFMPYEIGAVRRRSGKTILALGLTPPFGDPRPLSEVIATLEGLRREHTARDRPAVEVPH